MASSPAASAVPARRQGVRLACAGLCVLALLPGVRAWGPQGIPALAAPGGWFPVAPGSYGHLGRSGTAVADGEGLLLASPPVDGLGAAVRLRISGCDALEFRGLERAPGTVNFFCGSDPGAHRRGLPLYRSIEGRDRATGVGMLLQDDGKAVRYDLLLPDGVDPASVLVEVEGVDRIDYGRSGELLLRSGDFCLVQGRPVILVEVAPGVVEEIEAVCAMADARSFFFLPDRPLPPGRVRIDPRLEWGTYLGGATTFDDLRAMDSGPGGTLVVGGTTQALGGFFGGVNDFPVTPGAYQVSASQRTVFVAGLLNDGAGPLHFSTFLGGSAQDDLHALAVDGLSGAVSLCGGTTSANFPATATAFQTALAGTRDGWVAQLNASGTALLFSTYVGGAAGANGLPPEDELTCIAGTAAGFLVVGGSTKSTDMPVGAGAYQAASSGFEDGWLGLFDPGQIGSAQLLGATYLGGSDDDRIRALALSGPGHVLVAGSTVPRPVCVPAPFGPPCPTAAPFPVTAGAWQTLPDALGEGFVARLLLDGTGLAQASLAGGSGSDSIVAVKELGSGEVLLAGNSTGSGPPLPGGGHMGAPAGGTDAFVLLLDGLLETALAGTFFGGTGDDELFALAEDGGRWLAAGRTTSQDLPVTGHALDRDAGGGYDAFFAAWDSSGAALHYSTLIAGELNDEARAIQPLGGDRYGVGGTTSSAAFPTTRDTFQPLLGGFREAFTTAFHLGPPPPVGIEPACRGEANVLLEFPAGAPFPGHAGFTVTVDGSPARAYMPVFLAVQDRGDSFGPRLLGFFSATPVSFILDPAGEMALLPGVANSLGRADFLLPIPLVPGIVDRSFALQGLVYDGLGAVSGMSLSDGARCIFLP